MKTTLTLTAAIITLILYQTVPVNANNLPPKIQVDRQMMAAKNHLLNEKYQQAANAMERILHLHVNVPNDFYFHYGNTLLKAGNALEAIKMLERYLIRSGKTSTYYDHALSLLAEAEPLADRQKIAQKKHQRRQQEQVESQARIAHELKTWKEKQKKLKAANKNKKQPIPSDKQSP